MNNLSKQNHLPYKTAHFWLLGLLAITFLAFWDSYFGQLAQASWSDHWHGITATSWILLMAFQSVVIHRGSRSLHRKAGLLLFVLLPLMVASFGLVIHAGIQKTVNQHPFYQLFGEALLTVDVLLFILVPIQVFLALKLRSNVYLHSALMFSTVMGLLPPVLSRLFSDYVPGLIVTGPNNIHLFEYALLLGMLVSFLLSLALFKLYPRFGWPWVLAAVMACVQYLLYATLGQTALWHHWVTSLSSISALWFFGFGLAMGILACLWGWHFGQRPVHTQPASLAGLQRN